MNVSNKYASRASPWEPISIVERGKQHRQTSETDSRFFFTRGRDSLSNSDIRYLIQPARRATDRMALEADTGVHVFFPTPFDQNFETRLFEKRPTLPEIPTNSSECPRMDKSHGNDQRRV